MNQLGKITGIMMVAVFTLTLLSACTTAGSTLGATLSDGKVVTACHATGDPANPYEEITITSDIYPVPAYGCPSGPVSISAGKIKICHATGNETKPYNLITVSVMGLNGHGTHEGDVYPLEDGSCPPATTTTTTTTPVSGDKITICHATGSKTNPYVEITVSVNGLNGHDKHELDVYPLEDGTCPATTTPVSGDKITICHATGSKTNPYNEITVSVNGLNGHGDHEGDIIPAPEGGCPGK